MFGPKISVIICTRNRFEDFRETVQSLLKQSRLPDELVVVDASDCVEIDAYLKGAGLPFEFRYYHTPPGLTHQRNYGIRESTGNLIYFFDDDVLLEEDYIERTQKVFESDADHRIGAVGGRAVESHGWLPMSFRPWLSGLLFSMGRFIFLEARLGDGRFLLSGMPTHPHHLNQSRFIECLSGCCMAFRKEVFEYAGFDENLTRYALMEDADISKQILDAGYKIYYEASARLEHKSSPGDRLNQEQLAEMRVVNYVYLHRKNWPQTWSRRIFFYWLLAGMFLMNIRQPAARRGVLRGIRRLLYPQSGSSSVGHPPLGKQE